MKRKSWLFFVATVIMLLSANCLLIKVPIGDFVNLRSVWFGVGLFVGGAFVIFMNFFVKRTYLKSRIHYEPREILLIGTLVCVVGIVNVLYATLCVQFIESVYINVIMQIFISALIVLAMREVYSYWYEYPIRKVLRVMDKAGQLIDNVQYKQALIEFEDVERELDSFKRPRIFGWIKQSKGLCYIEMSKREDKKANLLLAVHELQEILKLEELKGQHGQVKVDIGNIYYDIAQAENDMDYYEDALSYYEDALKQYELDKDFDGCMNAMQYAERTRTVLVLERTS